MDFLLKQVLWYIGATCMNNWAISNQTPSYWHDWQDQKLHPIFHYIWAASCTQLVRTIIKSVYCLTWCLTFELPLLVRPLDVKGPPPRFVVFSWAGFVLLVLGDASLGPLLAMQTRSWTTTRSGLKVLPHFWQATMFALAASSWASCSSSLKGQAECLTEE